MLLNKGVVGILKRTQLHSERWNDPGPWQLRKSRNEFTNIGGAQKVSAGHPPP